MKKNLEYYLSLPYSVEVRELHEDDGAVSYFAKVVELPGCMTEGDTIEELWEMVADAKRMWIETALEDEATVPEPVNDRAYSGRFLLRTPATLHEQLAINAKAEGVSLNQYVSYLLSMSVGARVGHTA